MTSLEPPPPAPQPSQQQQQQTETLTQTHPQPTALPFPFPCYGEDMMGDEGRRPHAYSRKQKSLGLLCTNFIRLYNKDGIHDVGLDDAAIRLGVERRRIYDIVNVLESVGVLTRKAKNRYTWIGFGGIPKALEDLKEEAFAELSGIPKSDKFVHIKDQAFDDDEDDKSVDLESETRDEGFGSALKMPSSATSAPGRPRADNRREKSLGQLTQNFVKLFLTTKAETISLDEAARLLLFDGHDSAQMRTKVRRLYDIANVLSSLNLIEKTQHADSRKPAFKWLGFRGKPLSPVAVEAATTLKPCSKRAFGSDITNVESSKRSRFSSVGEERPRKTVAKSDDIRQCNLTAQRQLQGPKSFSFGPFQPLRDWKAEEAKEEKGQDGAKDWEALASSFRFQYQNQALSDLFAHYLEAYNSWFNEVVAPGKSCTQSH